MRRHDGVVVEGWAGENKRGEDGEKEGSEGRLIWEVGESVK